MARSSPDLMQWELFPNLPNGARLHYSSSGDPGFSTLQKSESVWLSPGSIITNYTLRATHINPYTTNIFDTATIHVKTPDLGIWRNGARLDTAAAAESGSITRILNPHRDETPGTGRAHGISLKLDPAGILGATPAVAGNKNKLKLKRRRNEKQVGQFPVEGKNSLQYNERGTSTTNPHAKPTHSPCPVRRDCDRGDGRVCPTRRTRRGRCGNANTRMERKRGNLY